MPLCKIVIWFISCILFYFLSSCKDYHRNKSHAYIPLASIRKGDQLAKKHCQSCHLLPAPSLLDAKTWEEGVLPVMGPRLGIFSHQFKRYQTTRDKNPDSNFYPSKPVLGPMEWQNILDYYTATSPDSVMVQKREKSIKSGLPLFRVQTPGPAFTLPATTFLKFVSAGNQNYLLQADLQTQSLRKFNSALEVIDSLPLAGTISDIDFGDNDMMICDMGQINPNNGKYGKTHYLFNDAGGKMYLDTVPVLSSLSRPVQIVSADLDNDKKTDYIICEFGFMKGSLTWFRNAGNRTYERFELSNLSGAIKLHVQDYNKDNLPDLWVLFAQGEEGVFLFTNQGKGQFTPEQVLRFPPVYGSTYFEMVDFNRDGYQDIVYTCGDNADYSRVLKPYHGIYIFLNDGKNHFKEKFFFAINGCNKAMALDFDEDGDLDIAAISFFADYERQPEEGFVYLENKGDLQFEPYTFRESGSGRWLTMDAGDLDGDGKPDIVLGNFSIGPVVIPSRTDWKDGPPFLVLKNTGKN